MSSRAYRAALLTTLSGAPKLARPLACLARNDDAVQALHDVVLVGLVVSVVDARWRRPGDRFPCASRPCGDAGGRALATSADAGFEIVEFSMIAPNGLSPRRHSHPLEFDADHGSRAASLGRSPWSDSPSSPGSNVADDVDDRIALAVEKQRP